jgi:hypothetical protein
MKNQEDFKTLAEYRAYCKGYSEGIYEYKKMQEETYNEERKEMQGKVLRQRGEK